MTPIFLVILTGILATRCTPDSPKKSSIITEVYEVLQGADNDYAKGKLKYMEIEYFEGDRMINKIFYNGDQTVRGKEIYSYEGNSKYPSGSKYYDPSGAIMSTYKYQFRDSLKVKAEAFEGEDGELLRIEGFQYDDKGNMISKTIYNSLSQKQKSFVFDHDSKGNEIQMILLDQNDHRQLTETYEIVTINDKGEWLEKWGYLNDNPAPVTFYHKRKSE